jgi:hypothetical protein
LIFPLTKLIYALVIADGARFPDTVQRHERASRASSARHGGAPQIRDRCKLCVCNDPGSAAHHFMLRCARDTNNETVSLLRASQ